MIVAFWTGLSSGLALIIAIGSQNAFVLRQGLKREHVLPLVLFCGLSDAILIGLGVLGFGALVTSLPLLLPIAKWVGVAFLSVYGLTRLWAAWQGTARGEAGQTRNTLGSVLLLAAAFTWLNPHVYLDTLALMGVISTCFVSAELKVTFFLGGASGSLLFFTALGYGARYLAPLFASPRAWRILDIIIALVMFALALKLALGALSGTHSTGC